MKNLALSLAVVVATAAPTSAAVYNITSIEDGTVPGFGFSLFHDQFNSRMSGDMLEDPDASELDAASFWNTNTGEIVLNFGLADGDGYVAGSGILELKPGANFGDNNAVGGYIDMTFTNAMVDGTFRIDFSDGLQSGPANGANSDFTFLSLWGDHDWGQCGMTCFGVDLRVGLEIAPVPLPASALLLLGGIGGLGAMRKLRKKS